MSIFHLNAISLSSVTFELIGCSLISSVFKFSFLDHICKSILIGPVSSLLFWTLLITGDKGLVELYKFPTYENDSLSSILFKNQRHALQFV